jgi:GNAT superfamily N-acetyltransferase
MINELSRAHVIKGLEENLWSFWERFGKGDGCTLHRTDFATWYETPIPIIPYNTVIRFESDGDAEAQIAEIMAHYEQRAVVPAWILHPGARPSNLEGLLAARGLVEAEVVEGMAMHLADVPPVAVPGGRAVIEEIAHPDEVGDYLDLAAWRWEVPTEAIRHLEAMVDAFHIGEPGAPVRLWVARLDGKAVAKVALNLDNGVAGIYAVATLPEARGLGLARALILTSLHAARHAGFNLSVLHSTPMAVSLYERIGFEHVAPFKVYAPPGVNPP